MHPIVGGGTGGGGGLVVVVVVVGGARVVEVVLGTEVAGVTKDVEVVDVVTATLDLEVVVVVVVVGGGGANWKPRS